MPKLLDWCDEAATVHWTQESPQLPDWEEAHRRISNWLVTTGELFREVRKVELAAEKKAWLKMSGEVKRRQSETRFT